MGPEEPQTKYLKLNEFLERNPCVNRRTFTRWKRLGLIDCLQPGGPNTQILVPEDALRRMEICRERLEQSDEENDSQSRTSVSPKGVRRPNWMNNT